MTAEEVAAGSADVVPALLLAVYEAFGEADEAGAYDGLAAVASGPALEALYFERMGAMAGAGLSGADQTIHEMEILEIGAEARGGRVGVEARWQVIGTVGHGGHEHVRGDAYAARLDLAPVDGGWRIVGFDLGDVDRSAVGRVAAGERP